jgi:hypothetical protein
MRRRQSVSNTTSTYWDVNGQSLQTYAFNVESLAGKFNTPPLRGQDRQFAYKAGAAHRDRTFDSNTLQLGMWVLGANENGTVSAGKEFLFRANMKKLQQLFVSPYGKEFAITKRWRDSSGGPVISATGYGILPQGLQPATEGGPYRAKVVADILMADPFFYGAPVTVPIPLGAPVVINNPGDVVSNRMTITYTGQLSNPVLTNTTPNPDVWLKLGTALAIGDSITVDVDQTTVKRTSDSANLIGAVTHSGARAWMGLLPGTNSIQLTTDIGAGAASITYQPVYY